jgi:CDP-glucose 4,6-dehydratase
MNRDFWRDRSVFLTGHTGFKGGWLALLLSELGARVHGYSLDPSTNPSFFVETELFDRLNQCTTGDIRDLSKLIQSLTECEPSVVIHMAAQPLVRASYLTPTDTFTTNVIGTVNLLEAARQAKTVEAIVCITTDKCYENKEWVWPYRETDRLGGHDPYSSSKACAELTVTAYRNSFFADMGIQLASARAGNVIGGGDWAPDRLIPDLLRATDVGNVISIRSPNAIRPWQHVLEPLSGYLLLAEKLVTDGVDFASAWNFGPEEADAKPVLSVIESFIKKVPGAKWRIEEEHLVHEAGLLKLDSSKARSKLNWKSRWCLETALDMTIGWHQAWKRQQSMYEFSIRQIESYLAT